MPTSPLQLAFTARRSVFARHGAWRCATPCTINVAPRMAHQPTCSPSAATPIASPTTGCTNTKSAIVPALTSRSARFHATMPTAVARNASSTHPAERRQRARAASKGSVAASGTQRNPREQRRADRDAQRVVARDQRLRGQRVDRPAEVAGGDHEIAAQIAAAPRRRCPTATISTVPATPKPPATTCASPSGSRSTSAAPSRMPIGSSGESSAPCVALDRSRPIAPRICGSAKPAHESSSSSARSRRGPARVRRAGRLAAPARGSAASAIRNSAPRICRATTRPKGPSPSSASFVSAGVAPPMPCAIQIQASVAGRMRRLSLLRAR